MHITVKMVKSMLNVNTGASPLCTFTADILEKEEIADRLSLLCIVSCVSLHVYILTPIYSHFNLQCSRPTAVLSP